MSRCVRFHIVSLGCPKNTVDAQVMLGDACAHGLVAVDDPARAEVIVINTCGFIDAAKKESIDTIFELAQYKRVGSCKRIVVAGCLVQRYASQLAEQIPEIDVLIGTGDVMHVASAIQGLSDRVQVGPAQGFLPTADTPRALTGLYESAYIKIAEGCNRHCTFCVIPKIKGKLRSRPIYDIAREARDLADQGVMEINVVCQDTLSYGTDITGKSELAALLQTIADIPGIQWVRALYLYPDLLDDALIDVFSGHPRVVKYIDMPMQHASDDVLKRMGRGHNQAQLRSIVEKLRTRIDDVCLRSAFIVGFPGETDRDFERLLAFLRWAKFDYAGFFRYSDEHESASHLLEPKVSPRINYNRWRKAMAVQRRISRAVNRSRRGKIVPVLVEGPSSEHPWVLQGRFSGQAPEVDGHVLFTDSDVEVGQMWQARVTQSMDFDLVVKVEGDEPFALSKRVQSNIHLPVIG